MRHQLNFNEKNNKNKIALSSDLDVLGRWPIDPQHRGHHATCPNRGLALISGPDEVRLLDHTGRTRWRYPHPPWSPVSRWRRSPSGPGPRAYPRYITRMAGLACPKEKARRRPRPGGSGQRPSRQGSCASRYSMAAGVTGSSSMWIRPVRRSSLRRIRAGQFSCDPPQPGDCPVRRTSTGRVLGLQCGGLRGNLGLHDGRGTRSSGASPI